MFQFALLDDDVRPTREDEGFTFPFVLAGLCAEMFVHLAGDETCSHIDHLPRNHLNPPPNQFLGSIWRVRYVRYTVIDPCPCYTKCGGGRDELQPLAFGGGLLAVLLF